MGEDITYVLLCLVCEKLRELKDALSTAVNFLKVDMHEGCHNTQTDAT